MVALVQAGSYSVDHFAKFDHDEVVAPILLYKDMTAHVASFNPGIALNMLGLLESKNWWRCMHIRVEIIISAFSKIQS